MTSIERFACLADMLISQLQASGRARTASSYRSAVNSVHRLLDDDTLPLEGLFSPQGVHIYERRLYDSGVCSNTVSFYLRTLRAIYNKGVAQGLYKAQPQLFANVYTAIAATPKRAVAPGVMGQLQDLDLSASKSLAFARDLFLLSYSLQGIPFIDLAFLRKSNLKDGMISYHRAKTNSPVVVPLSSFAQELIDRYTAKASESPYLLPIIKNADGDVHLQYNTALHGYNWRLKKLAKLAGVTEKLTSYVARHTWATTAQQQEVSTGVISQGMGHRTEEVTQIYLARFNYSALYRATEKVLIAANLIPATPTTPTTPSSAPQPAAPKNERKEEKNNRLQKPEKGKKENVHHLTGDGKGEEKNNRLQKPEVGKKENVHHLTGDGHFSPAK